MPEYTYGIDVSHWSGRLNYAKILASGYGKYQKIPVFNYIKASEGRLYRDNLYAYHLMASRQAGILTGAYHYYREIYDPVVQGRLFATIYNDNGATDLPPCLDVEIINNPYLSPARVLECALTIADYTGRKPIIYTGYYVWRDKMRSAAWGAGYPLWIADYTPPLTLPSPWTAWTFYQFSDSRGDENWFNGSRSDLDLLTTGQYTPPASTTKQANLLQIITAEIGKLKRRLQPRHLRRPDPNGSSSGHPPARPYR
jgi:lysozyme